MSAPGGRLDLLLKPGHFRFRTGKSEASAGMSASLIIGRHPHILSCPRGGCGSEVGIIGVHGMAGVTARSMWEQYR
jgi:hypothetical protein